MNDAALTEENGRAWAKAVPYDVRDEGVRDYLKALKTSKALVRAGHAKKFEVSFRSRKAEQQSLVVHKKHWAHRRGDYADVFGASVLRGHQRLPEKLESDSRLVRTRLGHYYLCMPVAIEIQAAGMETGCDDERGDNQVPPDVVNSRRRRRHAVISLDPGVRTFMTGYDADGRTAEWGAGAMRHITALCEVLDDLQSRWSQAHVRARKRYRLRKAARRVRLRIRNTIDDLHRRLAKWLCESYRVVLLPVFETSRMVRKGYRRRLASKTARAMCTLSHYRFRERLLAKAREYPDCRVVLTEEPYTSKTCGACGWLHQKLGGAKEFRCGRVGCGAVFDRDLNGARNILLRYLTLHCKEDAPTLNSNSV